MPSPKNCLTKCNSSVSLSQRSTKVRLIKRNRPVSTAPELCLTKRSDTFLVSVAAPPKKFFFNIWPSRTINFVSAAENNYSDEAELYSFSGPRKCLTKRIASLSNILPEEAKHFSHSDWQICFNKAEIFRLNASSPPRRKKWSQEVAIKIVFCEAELFYLIGPLQHFFLSAGCVYAPNAPPPAGGPDIYFVCAYDDYLCLTTRNCSISVAAPPKKIASQF